MKEMKSGFFQRNMSNPVYGMNGTRKNAGQHVLSECRVPSASAEQLAVFKQVSSN
jgi:hypothetical protein